MVASLAGTGDLATVRPRRGRHLLPPVASFTVGATAVAYVASDRVDARDLTVVVLLSSLTWPVAATVLVEEHPGLPLGRLLAVPGSLPLIGTVAAMPAGGPRPRPLDVLAAGGLPAALFVAVAFVAMPLLVSAAPDHTVPGQRRAAVVPVTLAACALVAAVSVLPGVALSGRVPDARYVAAFTGLLLTGAVLSAHLVVGRAWRRSAGAERDRLGWYLLGSVVTGSAMVGLGGLVAVQPGPLAVYALAALVATMPCAAAALELSAAPPALDLALARGAAFVGVTVALAVVYVATVAGLAASGLPDGPVGAAVLTGTAALLAVPLWSRCRCWSERLLFGAGRRPEAVLAGMRRGVQDTSPGGALAAVTDWVAEALRSPEVRVRDRSGSAEPPEAVGGVAVELRVAGSLIGWLEVAPRTTGERYGRRDRALLDQLAVPVALVAQSVAAARALVLSEQRVIDERLRERRRVLDDLHDGLGPALAGAGLQLEAARSRLRRSGVVGDDGVALLDAAVTAVQQAGAGMRQLVLDLGSEPGHTAERSFADSVTELVDGWSAACRDKGLAVRLGACTVPPALAPGTATAAYRIIGEAVTNVVRHARATSCSIRVEQLPGPRGTEEIVVRVQDNGRGLGPGTDASTGTGLRSMRSRTEALGGSLETVDAPGGGTVLTARIPLSEVRP